ncbi:hypothetical protein [Fluviispira vulneris]|uniref:hypothetical protein n=1 Tax=Fluviispira vulneris TaxID=2763012 RepID=UPI0016446D45|nr:hypothetical protein [Fluviispira vulneris]
MILKSKIYKAFVVFLNRKKIKHKQALAISLHEKYFLAKRPSDWQSIKAENLKSKGVLLSETHQSFSICHNDIIKKNILICVTIKQELNKKKGTQKASFFKCRNVISKYIEQAISSKLPYKVNNLFGKYVDLSKNILSKAIRERVTKIKAKFRIQVKNVNNLKFIAIETFSPSIPVRKKILLNSVNYKKECNRILTNEIQSNR